MLNLRRSKKLAVRLFKGRKKVVKLAGTRTCIQGPGDAFWDPADALKSLSHPPPSIHILIFP